ncbi:DUF3108 domain-containing protein [Methylobacterium sp. BTF04]|uniref:DUF3108 domain-containing protein n=1 Tax=Methylobacterium sp. BTF04 TaxID=2708300 RepID=UPI0013D04A37|nr:DUF3108 domain-containing protein [Methylobacterium sp. BTF04]NEU14495.1 DUF3108 domain-containing protein [Methylobacterium sp. BTF04]
MDAGSDHPLHRQAVFHRAALLCAAIAAWPAFAGEPGPPRFTATYTLTFLGLPVGEANLAMTQGAELYAIDLNAALRGVAGVFVDGSGKASVSGVVSRDRAVTAAFAFESHYAGKPIVASLRLEKGRVRDATVEPPPTPRPDRVPVAPQDRIGVVDPLSMLAVPLGAAPLAPALCDRRIPVFDGASRADLVLSRGTVVAVEEGAYRGPALDCRVRWVPISGHRAHGTNIRRMAANDDMQVRLAPALDGAVLLPLSIAVATGWGTVRIEATQWGAPAPSLPPAQAAESGSVRIRLPNAR